MALHRRHAHDQVLRGEAAREHLAIRKREMNRDTPVMHVPANFALEKRQKNANGIQVVYVTLPQTFSGPAIYITMSSEPATASAAVQTKKLETGPVQARVSSTAVASATATSTAVVFPTVSSSNTPSYASTTMATSSRMVGSPLQAGQTASSTASSSAEESNSSGMTGGAKAGIAFGIIILIGALAGAAYFFLWRRKKQTAARNGEMLNEKHSSFPRSGGIGAAAATGAFAAPAMRSMDNNRSMEQREPMASKLDSAMTEKVPASTTSTAPRLSLRPMTQLMPGFGGDRTSTGAQFDGAPRDNPFNDVSEQGRSNSPSSGPFNGASPAPNGSSQSLAAMAAGGVAASPGPNNVHRVQLDFKPSMDDELELRSGQLVRMLHEYDDGWALCIRMDRSQQGVVPRTCLSKLPVKPRPQGPPPGQGSRPGTANSNRGPPNAPGMMVPRPLTPSSSDRAISPPMRSDLRPQAENSIPPAGTMPARKPVPGQAM